MRDCGCVHVSACHFDQITRHGKSSACGDAGVCVRSWEKCSLCSLCRIWVGPESKRGSSDLRVSTTVEWIAMTFRMEMHGPQRIMSGDFDGALPFPLVPAGC